MTKLAYNRIIYPERAELLARAQFANYAVFLDHWDGLAIQIKSLYEEVRTRSATRILFIHGEQGCGKTMFANRLSDDYVKTRQGSPSSYDSGNVWHRIVSGFGRNAQLIESNTKNSFMHHFEDDKEWVKKVALDKHETRIVVLDNCERDYFVDGICSDDALAREERIDKAAQDLSFKARRDFAGCLFVMLTNDLKFADLFCKSVDRFHKGLAAVVDMPIPAAKTKEKVIRNNVNILNPFSYWFCLDKSGEEGKRRVYDLIQQPGGGFKDVFSAVDDAFSGVTQLRAGRPARKCMLNLFILTDSDSVVNFNSQLGISDGQVFYGSDIVDAVTYMDDWGDFIDASIAPNKRMLVESEWGLRIIICANAVSSLLISRPADVNTVRLFVNSMAEYHGSGAKTETVGEHKRKIDDMVSEIKGKSVVDLIDFWKLGQNRSQKYESTLTLAFPSYNRGLSVCPDVRPDLILTDYSPCSLLYGKDSSKDEMNWSIRRDAVLCEFTSIKNFKKDDVVKYLTKKIENYIYLMERV